MASRKKTSYEILPKSRDPSFVRKEGNLPAKKYKHSNPTELRLEFEFSGAGTKFIDIAKALSAINRKMFRQGAYYYVNSVEIYNNSDSLCDLHTVPDTWVSRNAHVRGKAIWNQMNYQVLRNHGTIVPKYHDFKVYMTELHRTTGSVSPTTYGLNAVANTQHSNDDWEYSQFVSADSDGDFNSGGTALEQQADNFYCHMIGPSSGSAANWQSVGLIESYGETRSRQGTGGTPVVEPANLLNDPLSNLFDYSSEEQVNDIITRLDEDNDNAPFDDDVYVGEQVNGMQHVARLVTTATQGRVATAGGFCAPFGLICVDSQAQQGDLYRIVLMIAPGTYNGVYAERV